MVGFENKMYSENNASPVGDNGHVVVDNGHAVSSISPAVVDMEITEEPIPGPSAGIHVDTDDPGSNLEGISLKPTLGKEPKKLRNKAIRQVVYSVVRNMLCYCCIVSLIAVLSSAGGEFHLWLIDEKIIILMMLCLGFVAVPFQVMHVVTEFRYKKPTLVLKMLMNQLSIDEFNRLIQTCQLSPPDMYVEIALRSGAMSQEDPEHWTNTTRKTLKPLPYNAWADQSKSIRSLKWPEEKSTSWIIVTKDFRCVDADTCKSIQTDIKEFSEDNGYFASAYFMTREIILQLTEVDSFDDVLTFLVYDKNCPGFYNPQIYKICLCLCLDCLYHIFFHILTPKMHNYSIVKFVER